jgi:uncharacterized protein (TIGR02453 family)
MAVYKGGSLATGFIGFPQGGIDFFRKLARNNRREWFQPRKAIFEEKVKQPMRGLVEAVNGALARFAPDYVTDPGKAIYRIYRDTRFSNDKTPYKEHIAASFHRHTGMAHGDAGYYFQISHKNVGLGGGVYMPEPATLLAIRSHIAARHEDLRQILAGRTVKSLFRKLEGEQLSRVPKGFCAEHPAADLLRYKYFILWAELPPEIATTPELFREIVKHFRAMVPFLNFLTEPLGRARRKIDARDLM